MCDRVVGVVAQAGSSAPPPHVGLWWLCFHGYCVDTALWQREKRVSTHSLTSSISAIALSVDQSLVVTAGQDKKLTCVPLVGPPPPGSRCLARVRTVGSALYALLPTSPVSQVLGPS
jgi:hypothetical protein